MKLAEVYIEHSSLQLDQSFSYLCGHAEVRPGMRVSVPFAKQQLVGFVDSVKEVSADELKQMPYALKEIQRVLDKRPLLNDELLQLGKWMAEQYVAPLISCYQAMLPGVLKPKSSARSAAMEEWACFAGEREGRQQASARGAGRDEAARQHAGRRLPAGIQERGQKAHRAGLCAHRKSARRSRSSSSLPQRERR